MVNEQETEEDRVVREEQEEREREQAEEEQKEREKKQQEMIAMLVEVVRKQEEQMKMLAEGQQRLIRELIDSNKSNTAALGAKTTTGEAPKFDGQVNNIAVYKWALSMDGWFASAGINTDEEKLNQVQANLRDSAQQWFVAEAVAALPGKSWTTWNELKEAMMKKYLATKPEVWARNSIKALTSRKSSNSNIHQYSNQYAELNQFIPGRAEEDRVFEYVDGLPMEYAVKLKEKEVKTLKEAIELATRIYNVRGSTNSGTTTSSSGRATPTASVNQMDWEASSTVSTSTTIVPGEEGNEQSTSTQSTPTTVTNMQEQLAQLTKMIGQMQQQQPQPWQGRRGGFSNRGGHRGGNNNYRGRGGNNNYRGRGGFNNKRGRSSSPEGYWKSYNLPDEVMEARRSSGACMKCGMSNHQAKECRNEVNQSN